MSRLSNRQHKRSDKYKQELALRELSKLTPPVSEKILNIINLISPEDRAAIDLLSFEDRLKWFKNAVNS